jgi:beta-xylosidase
METIARSRDLYGPYEENPANPILTNVNTSSYCEWYSYDARKDANVANYIIQSRQLGTQISSKIIAGTGMFRIIVNPSLY